MTKENWNKLRINSKKRSTYDISPFALLKDLRTVFVEMTD